MKKFLVSILIALFSSVSFANISSEQEFLLNRGLGDVGSKTQVGELLNRTANLLVAKYSFAVQGGSTAADISMLRDLTDPTSLAYLPAGAIIRNVVLQVLTSPQSPGLDTVAIRISGPADLYPVTGGSNIGGNFLAGTPVLGTTTTWVKLATTSTSSIVKLRLGKATNSQLTAGKFNAIIDYVIGD